MAPAQAMDAGGGDDEDVKKRKGHTPASAVVLKSEITHCVDSLEDNMAYHAAMPMLVKNGGGGGLDDDVVVDVFGNGNGSSGPVKNEEGGPSSEEEEVEEHSSSFGNSGSDEEARSESGAEVDSLFGKLDGDTMAADGSRSLFRRKNVTPHWREYISPIMWRCQWLELRMKELRSQASKYDKELALLRHEKDLQVEVMRAEGSLPRTGPLIYEGHGKSAMIRRKRKRQEDIIDSSLYTKKHPIFSYYENKGRETDVHLVDDDCNDLAGENVKGSFDTDWLLGTKEIEVVVKQNALKDILLSIDKLQSRVVELKGHLDKARCKGGDVNLAQTATCSSKKDQDRMSIGASHATSYKSSDSFMEDAGTNESVQKNKQDDTMADTNKITMMLFGAGNPLTDQIGDLCKENTDDLLIDNNQAAENGYQQFEEVSQPKEEPQELVEKATQDAPKGVIAESPSVKQETVLETEKVDAAKKIVRKPLYTGKKRGRKPKRKKREVSTILSSNQSKNPPSMPAEKKQKTEEATPGAAPNNKKGERVLLLTADSRRSQRVRKPKVYE